VNVAAMEGVARDGDDWNGESCPRYNLKSTQCEWIFYFKQKLQ